MRSLTLTTLIIMLAACTNITSKPVFQTEVGAIRGYDAVAYFTEERPVKGLTEFSYNHHNATWYFASQKNKELFENNPEKYLPQYGGYCAYGMANGFVVSSDPNAFTLVNSKLYLNYSLSVRNTWLKDIPGHIRQADENWQSKKQNR